jgi:hypothetical protein
MYYIGLDVHKKTISNCVKDASGQVHQEGKVGATRWELDAWIRAPNKTLFMEKTSRQVSLTASPEKRETPRS